MFALVGELRGLFCTADLDADQLPQHQSRARCGAGADHYADRYSDLGKKISHDAWYALWDIIVAL